MNNKGHDLVFDRDDGRHVFRCTKCGAEIAFVKTGEGTPNAIDVAGVLSPPDNVGDYMDPCTS